MARATYTELSNAIANAIQENTSGDITATVLANLLSTLLDGLYVVTPVTPAYGAMHITQDETNTITITTATTDDTMLPITQGTTYLHVTGFSAGVEENVTYNATYGGLQVGIAGDYRADGWLSVRHSVNGATVAVVFGIIRGGVYVGLSARPTPTKMPNGGDLGLISGGGSLNGLQSGDILVPLIASDTLGTVTVNNATLLVQLMKEA